MPYIWEPSPIVCDTRPQILHTDDSGEARWNESALRLAGLRSTDVRCVYAPINLLNDMEVRFGSPVNFSPPAYLPEEFFQIVCRNTKNTVVFEKLFSVIHKESPSVKRARVRASSASKLSVVMLGIDSVSRSAAIRKLPKTLTYLRDVLHSYDFRGLMKVGENTYPNLVAQQVAPRGRGAACISQPCDGLPFIWKNFSAYGYATMYAEDWAYEATFTNHKPGFRSPPTDHYMRNFWLALDEQESGQMSGIGALKNVLYPLEFTNLKEQGSETARRYCYNDALRYRYILDYLKQFMSAYTGQRRYAFTFANSIAHQVDNFLSIADDGYYEILKWLKTKGHLRNTVVMFFSDHGSRLERIRNTLVGRVEDRMPLLHLILPEHIKQKYPLLDKVLKQNQERLTTHKDVYKTISDILQGQFKPYKLSQPAWGGISLFSEIPKDRSCAQAGIPDSFCACHTARPLNLTQHIDIATKLQTIMIREINNYITGYPKCLKLEIYKLHAIRVISNGLHYTKSSIKWFSTLFKMFTPVNDTTERYEVVLQTVPGCGVFEATYEVVQKDEPVRVGDIVRINRYGGQAHCMPHKQLKMERSCTYQNMNAQHVALQGHGTACISQPAS
ncbi:uncharacterized protein LOC128227166 [Mya arenaria]|uniref:uncharacterized protein LOC128227166 n=1 Tax=Mya arenaria TaxID=6604 RepID=UPI0022E80D61|nr:uncharacterized protein LOC128227166 [Mya arenaria]